MKYSFHLHVHASGVLYVIVLPKLNFKKGCGNGVHGECMSVSNPLYTVYDDTVIVATISNF